MYAYYLSVIISLLLLLLVAEENLRYYMHIHPRAS